MHATVKWPGWMMLALGVVVGAVVGYTLAPARTTASSPSAIPVVPDVCPGRAQAGATGRPGKSATAVIPPATTLPGVAFEEFLAAMEDMSKQANPYHNHRQQADLVRWVDQLDPSDLHKAVEWVLKSPKPWLRMMFLQILFERLAATDPEGALRQAQAIPTLNERRTALTGVFQAWSRKNAVAVVRWLQSQPRGQGFDKMLEAAIPGLSENAPEAVYLLLQSMAPQLLRNYSWQLFTGWARTDPVTALSKMMGMPAYRNGGGVMQGIISEWAQRDFPAAEAWANALPRGTARAEAIRGLVGALATKDPARAAAMVLAMPDVQEQINALSMMMGSWSQSDLVGAMAWMKQLPEGNLKQAAVNQIMGSWATTNPREAAEYALSMPAGKNRNHALSSLVGSWAYSDAKSALEWIKGMTSGREQQVVIQSSIYGLAQAEPAATAALLDQLPTSAARRNCLGSLLQAWVEIDPGKALEWAAALPSSADRAQAYQHLAYSSWARNSPTQAVAVLMSLPAGQQRNSSLSSVISQWAYQDFSGALEWSLKLEDASLRKQTLQNLQGRWIEINPLEAVNFVREQKEGSREGALSSAVGQWARNDPVSAITWATQLSAPEMEKVLPSAIGAWADNDPVEAARYVSQLQPGKMQNEAAGQVVSRWAQQDPARVAKWVDGFANEELRIRACRDVANAWVQNDPDAVGAWVREMPAGKPREAAVQALVSSLQYADPKAAIQWAEAVSDPSQRNQMMEHAARRWLENDSAAKVWIVNSSLSQEAKNRLLLRDGK